MAKSHLSKEDVNHYLINGYSNEKWSSAYRNI